MLSRPGLEWSHAFLLDALWQADSVPLSLVLIVRLLGIDLII